MLDGIEFYDLEKDLISNVDARSVLKKDEIKEKLVKQVSKSLQADPLTKIGMDL